MICALRSQSLSTAELVRFLGMASRTGSLKRTIAELMELGVIEYTIPDKPTSRLQKYRLTQKGRLLLRQMDEAGRQ